MQSFLSPAPSANPEQENDFLSWNKLLFGGASLAHSMPIRLKFNCCPETRALSHVTPLPCPHVKNKKALFPVFASPTRLQAFLWFQERLSDTEWQEICCCTVFKLKRRSASDKVFSSFRTFVLFSSVVYRSFGLCKLRTAIAEVGNRRA